MKALADRYGGWLEDDGRGGLVVQRGRHAGSLLDSVPDGYLRWLLGQRIPPAVRVAVLVAVGEVGPEAAAPPPADGERWVPFLLGDLSGHVHADVAALFLTEYGRLARLAGSDEPTRVLEAMAALSSSTPGDSIR